MSTPHRLRFGRRGRVLLFFGLLDLVYGFSLAFPDHETRKSVMFVWLAEVAPPFVWGLTWFLVGVVCLWQAFRRHDQAGFASAIALKVCWGLVSLGGWVLGGVERGYVSAAIWLGLAWFVWNCAGWPEPDLGKEAEWTRPLS